MLGLLEADCLDTLLQDRNKTKEQHNERNIKHYKEKHNELRSK